MLATLCTIVVVQWGNRKFDVLTISCYRRVVAKIELKFRLVSIEKRAAIYRALVLCSVWSYLPIIYSIKESYFVTYSTDQHLCLLHCKIVGIRIQLYIIYEGIYVLLPTSSILHGFFDSRYHAFC